MAITRRQSRCAFISYEVAIRNQIRRNILRRSQPVKML
jgi:hypothetical protein